ncbi:MAG: GNAT family N-acetyltransferase [Halodesulfurarchaeum sp.]
MPGPVAARGTDVSLRLTRTDDASFIQRAGCNPAVKYPLGGRPRSIEALAAEIKDSDADRYLVCLENATDDGPEPEGATPIGAVTIEDAGWKRPELTYWILPEAQGEGYGGEGVGLAVDLAFRDYEAPAVGAACYAFNDASRGVLESLGFEQEGRRHDYMFVDGAWRDYIVFGLRRRDWEPRATRH